jgi:hypothetical protein
VIDSSGAYTGAGQHGAALPDLTIGETVTYELRVRLQEGTTPIIITDTLPLVWSSSVPNWHRPTARMSPSPTASRPQLLPVR